MEEIKQSFKSIPFIIYDKQFEINPEAITFLNQFREKIGVISICGKYRTGKSYLLNRLVEDKIEQSTSNS